MKIEAVPIYYKFSDEVALDETKLSERISEEVSAFNKVRAAVLEKIKAALEPTRYKNSHDAIRQSLLSEEFQIKPISYGLLQSFAQGINDFFTFCTPQIDKLDSLDEFCLQVIIEIIGKKDFSAASKRLINIALKLSPQLKFYLLDSLMPERYSQQARGLLHYKIKELNHNDAQDLINFLIDCGAEYKHLMLEPDVSLDHMRVYMQYFGREKVINLTVAGVPFINTILTGHFGDNRQRKFEFFIENNCDINMQDPHNGTFLHVLLANELTEVALNCIDVVEKSKKIPFVYTARDEEGKTPLLIACKLCQVKVVNKFRILKNQGVDVGVNICDKKGRTPLLIAAALGQKKIVSYLLQMGADLDIGDNEGRNLDWYISAPKEAVADILKSIYVEPERSLHAPHNWIYFNDPLARPLVVEESKEEHKRVLISGTEENAQLIDRVLTCARDHDVNLYFHILSQVRPLLEQDKRTILDACLAGQREVSLLIARHRERLLREYCAVGDFEKVKHFIASGVNVNATDNDHRNTLHFSVMRVALVRKIMASQGMSENEIDAQINNRMANHPVIFCYLLEKGANSNIKNSNNNSPKDILLRESQTGSEKDKEVAANMLELFKKFDREPPVSPLITHGVFNKRPDDNEEKSGSISKLAPR